MVNELINLLSYPFIQNTIYASLLASLACGIVGTLVICNRLTFLAGGASHAAYGGIGLALYFQWPILPSTILFSLAASLIMGVITLRENPQATENVQSTDAAIGILWAAGMAFGIILIELTPGYAGELMGFLFGSIISVPTEDIYSMALFDGLLLLILMTTYQGIWAVSLDKVFAQARGLPVTALYLLIIGLTAITVVFLIRIVGLILVIALLTIPPAIARKFCATLPGTMVLACILSLTFCLGGLIVSWTADLSSGASIIAIATACYFFSSFASGLMKKYQNTALKKRALN